MEPEAVPSELVALSELLVDRLEVLSELSSKMLVLLLLVRPHLR